MYIISFSTAKVRIIIYIASDLIETLRLFNNKSCTTQFYFDYCLIK